MKYRLPLSKDVPVEFRVLPEYMIEDVIEYMVFVTRSVNVFNFVSDRLMLLQTFSRDC
jgi:hypothetical protein